MASLTLQLSPDSYKYTNAIAEAQMDKTTAMRTIFANAWANMLNIETMTVTQIEILNYLHVLEVVQVKRS